MSSLKVRPRQRGACLNLYCTILSLCGCIWIQANGRCLLSLFYSLAKTTISIHFGHFPFILLMALQLQYFRILRRR
jgi:hypothetical protein